jgi:hypothetical protein
MLGLGIFALEQPKVYGINYNGKLEELLQLRELANTKRKDPISDQDIKKIIEFKS